MNKVTYTPKVYGTLDNIFSEIRPEASGIISNKFTKMSPTVTGCFNKGCEITTSNQTYGVVSPPSTITNFVVSAVVETPTKKILHNDNLKIDMNVFSKNYSQKLLKTTLTVERVGKTIDDDTTIVGYDTSVYPFFTYHFTNREELQMYPFITYTLDGGVEIDEYPFVTYKDYTFGGKKTERIYYINFYSEYMDKMIKCRLYDTPEGFPIKDVHLSVVCDDNKRRYCPLDHVNYDFDSGVRVNDNYGNEYQISVARQENIINRYFPFGNIVIPLTTYDDLYTILTGIFGTARVKLGENKDCIYFTPPSASSGITQFFAIGLNIRITNHKDATLTTYNNGLNRTSFGGDFHWTANSMLIKMNHRETFKLEFDNSYYGTSYAENAPVKNAIVLGATIEALPRESSSYELLLRNNKWFLYDVRTNYIKVVDNHNMYIDYFIKNYLDYPNTKHMYNYYDLQKMRYEKEIDLL